MSFRLLKGRHKYNIHVCPESLLSKIAYFSNTTCRTTKNIKDADDATLIQMGTFLADISDTAKGQLDKVGLSRHRSTLSVVSFNTNKVALFWSYKLAVKMSVMPDSYPFRMSN